MNPEDIDFIYAMVEQLDMTIRKLALDEERILQKISDERVEELKEYWQHELSDEEEQELKGTFDHWDKVLMSNWAHSQRAHETRVLAGQKLMHEKL